MIADHVLACGRARRPGTQRFQQRNDKLVRSDLQNFLNTATAPEAPAIVLVGNGLVVECYRMDASQRVLWL